MAKRKKWGKRPDNAPINFVHRHDIGINTARTHRDRKKDAKRGAQKHQTAKADQGGFFVPFIHAAALMPNERGVVRHTKTAQVIDSQGNQNGSAPFFTVNLSVCVTNRTLYTLFINIAQYYFFDLKKNTIFLQLENKLM